MSSSVIIILFSLIIMWLFFIEGKDFIMSIIIKLNSKSIRENTVDMLVEDKLFLRGELIGCSKYPTRCTDSYNLTLSQGNRQFYVNNKEIFDLVEIGDYIKVNLIEILDKKQNIINYEIKHL